jgi:hypothetical protein
MIGRPETHPIKKIIGFTQDMIDAVESWRAKQKPVPNLSEAIRQLVEIALTTGTKAAPSQRLRAERADRAKELAAKTIEKIIDPAAPPDERTERKRRLTKGPSEFRDARVDQPRAKPKP